MRQFLGHTKYIHKMYLILSDTVFKRPFLYFQNDSYAGQVWYTKKDSTIYGISLFWPDDGVLEVNNE